MIDLGEGRRTRHELSKEVEVPLRAGVELRARVQRLGEGFSSTAPPFL